jgi:hypothetical protein
VCLRLLSSLPNAFPLTSDDVASQSPSSLTLEITKTWKCDFEFLDQDFLDILHDSYVDHLSYFKYDFATTTDGVLWEKAHSEYSETILKRAQEWVTDKEEGLIEGPVYDRLRLLIPRLKYLLSNGASKSMPVLRGIGNTPPLFCPRHYIDMGVELVGLEDVGIHVSISYNIVYIFLLRIHHYYTVRVIVVEVSLFERYLPLLHGPCNSGRNASFRARFTTITRTV